MRDQDEAFARDFIQSWRIPTPAMDAIVRYVTKAREEERERCKAACRAEENYRSAWLGDDYDSGYEEGRRTGGANCIDAICALPPVGA